MIARANVRSRGLDQRFFARLELVRALEQVGRILAAVVPIGYHRLVKKRGGFRVRLRVLSIYADRNYSEYNRYRWYYRAHHWHSLDCSHEVARMIHGNRLENPSMPIAFSTQTTHGVPSGVGRASSQPMSAHLPHISAAVGSVDGGIGVIGPQLEQPTRASIKTKMHFILTPAPF